MTNPCHREYTVLITAIFLGYAEYHTTRQHPSVWNPSRYRVYIIRWHASVKLRHNFSQKTMAIASDKSQVPARVKLGVLTGSRFHCTVPEMHFQGLKSCKGCLWFPCKRKWWKQLRDECWKWVLVACVHFKGPAVRYLSFCCFFDLLLSTGGHMRYWELF